MEHEAGDDTVEGPRFEWRGRGVALDDLDARAQLLARQLDDVGVRVEPNDLRAWVLTAEEPEERACPAPDVEDPSGVAEAFRKSPLDGQLPRRHPHDGVVDASERVKSKGRDEWLVHGRSRLSAHGPRGRGGGRFREA